jgi:hypothetical protein
VAAGPPPGSVVLSIFCRVIFKLRHYRVFGADRRGKWDRVKVRPGSAYWGPPAANEVSLLLSREIAHAFTLVCDGERGDEI